MCVFETLLGMESDFYLPKSHTRTRTHAHFSRWQILDLANFSDDDDTPIVLVDLKAKPESPRERTVPVPTFTEVTPPSPSGGGGRPVDMSESDSSDGDADVDDDEPLPPSAAPARPPKKTTSTGSGDDAGGPSRPRASKPTNVPGLAAAPARPQRGRRKAPDAASGGDDLLPPRPARPVRPVVNTSGQRSVLGGLVAKERKSRRVSLLRGHSRRVRRKRVDNRTGKAFHSLLCSSPRQTGLFDLFRPNPNPNPPNPSFFL